MKKVIDASIGGYNFALEDDAYYLLKDYLTRFERTILDPKEAKEVMEDVEARVAEVFQREKKYPEQVINLEMVKTVISLLGEVDNNGKEKSEKIFEETGEGKTTKRFYRDPDDKKIAGVCSGVAAYFNIDATLVRILFLVALVAYGSTFFVYIIIWLATKEARTVIQKLEMRGIPVTAENIKKYTTENK